MRRIVENIRFGLFLVVLICVLAAALFWALSIGTVHLSLSQIYGAIVQQLESGRTIEAPGQDRSMILCGFSVFPVWCWRLSWERGSRCAAW